MIYHYTSAEVLFKILDNVYIDKRNPDDWSLFITLRATHASFLNDLTEGQLLPNVLRKINIDENILHVAEMFNGYPFVISFSRDPDSLDMWRGYGLDGKGVALGFNESFFDNHYEKCDCVYTTENKLVREIKKNELWKEYSNNPSNILPLVRLLLSSLKYKNKAFLSEKEYRIYMYKYLDEKFYVKGSSIIPYQDIEIPIEALQEITLGPNTDSDKMTFSIQRMLIKAKNDIDKYRNLLEKIEIRHSQIPYIN